MYVLPKSYYFFMVINIFSCVWKHSLIEKYFQGGTVSAVIENCTFVSISEDYGVGIYFVGALLVIIRNSSVQTNGKHCFYGCGIYMEGDDIIQRDIPGLIERGELLACAALMCNFKNSKLVIDNTLFRGNVYTTASVVYSRNLNLEVLNCIFNMSSISVEGGFLDHSSVFYHHSVKMSNITANISLFREPATIFTHNYQNVQIEDVLILCSQSLHIIERKRFVTKFYRCEYICQNGFHTFSAGKVTLHETYQKRVLLYSTVERSNITCFPCPVGASCDKKIMALPNYWEHKAKNGNYIIMIRCPENYCCSGSSTCSEIDSCNKDRTGILCGRCEMNLTESLFSADCIGQENCYRNVIFVLYFTLVLVYGIGIIAFIYLKDNGVNIANNIWKAVETKCKCKLLVLARNGNNKLKPEDINEEGMEMELHHLSNNEDRIKYQVVKVSPGGSHLGANWE